MAKGLKKGDMVVVISGENRAQSYEKRCGKLLVVDRKKNRVTIEGINIKKAALKRSSENPQGGFVEKECSIHISNVMVKEKYDSKIESKKKSAKS